MFALSVVAVTLGLGAWFARRSRITLGTLAAVCMTLPFLVPVDAPWPPRLFVLAIAGALIPVKIFDLAVAPTVDLPTYARLLLHPAVGVMRVHHLAPNPSRVASARLLAISAVEVGAGFVLYYAVDARPLPFLAEHTLKLVAFYLATLHGGLQGIVALLRLCGARAIEPSVHPVLATTPADFWRRYNRLVGQALYENVFLRVGGRRHAARGTLVAFAVNGIFHEYLATVMVGRVQGYQLGFFALHGAAVALTMRWRPAGIAAHLGRVGTLAFNVATAIPFCLSLDPIFDWYR
jgi:hypothetical protein